MSEVDLVKEFINATQELYGDSAHVSCVESPITSPGFPDLDVCIQGINIHIECKFSRNNRPPEIRPTQKRWHEKRLKAKGTCYLLSKFIIDDLWCYSVIPSSSIPALVYTNKLVDWVSESSKLIQLGNDNSQMEYDSWTILIEHMFGELEVRNAEHRSD